MCGYSDDSGSDGVSIPVNSSTHLFTIPDGVHFIKFGILTDTYGTTYQNDICINLSWSGYRNGEYEAYEKHSYALDDSLTLRGVPKLDASNNLYYDGDTYEPDGTVTRRYGVVDLGTLNYTFNNEEARIFVCAPPNMARVVEPPYENRQVGAICSKYPNSSAFQISALMDDKSWLRNDVRLFIRDTSYDDIATFKTAMSGVYLVYELATPTTETADAYSQVQICNDFGTEEFVSTGIVPVGHETRYPANLRDKLQHLPSLADSDGTYLITQADRQMTLTPYSAPTGLPDAPTTDGTYTLIATVSDGTVTYSWEATS